VRPPLRLLAARPSRVGTLPSLGSLNRVSLAVETWGRGLGLGAFTGPADAAIVVPRQLRGAEFGGAER